MILISYFDRNTIKGLEICRYNALETIIFSLDQIIFSLDQIIFSLDQIIFSLDTILPATVLFSDTGKWAQVSTGTHEILVDPQSINHLAIINTAQRLEHLRQVVPAGLSIGCRNTSEI
ncbi:uncharacterized protein LOC143210627 isoform X1 [Lasioglossum baleicum]|uniref:uncharacterized protein LOC143210627 isoform X1 n=1 Tax=Lasioglossum baleicum TaxID=434251 RepID=UPI003FCCF943